MSIVTININADLSAMEQRMADMQAAIDELKATIEAEKAEVAEVVASLTSTIAELKTAIENGQADDEMIVAKLVEVNEGIKGIFAKPEPPVE